MDTGDAASMNSTPASLERNTNVPSSSCTSRPAKTRPNGEDRNNNNKGKKERGYRLFSPYTATRAGRGRGRRRETEDGPANG